MMVIKEELKRLIFIPILVISLVLQKKESHEFGIHREIDYSIKYRVLQTSVNLAERETTL